MPNVGVFIRVGVCGFKVKISLPVFSIYILLN
jgi:hypothetical protein